MNIEPKHDRVDEDRGTTAEEPPHEQGYLPNDPCPDCGKPMSYDEGEPATWSEPGEAPAIYCMDCGVPHAVSLSFSDQAELSSSHEGQYT